MALTLEQVAALVDDTRRKRRLQQDPYFYGAEERPGALLSNVDKVGLYGELEGSMVPEDRLIEGGSFELRESIPERFVESDVLGFNDAGITQVPEEVRGIISDRTSYYPPVNAYYQYDREVTPTLPPSMGFQGPTQRGAWHDAIVMPHPKYGGPDDSPTEGRTLAHEVQHRGYRLLDPYFGKPEDEHKQMYSIDPDPVYRARGYDNPMEGDVKNIVWDAYADSAQNAPESFMQLIRKHPEMKGLLVSDEEKADTGSLLSADAGYDREGDVSDWVKSHTKSGSGGDVTPTTLKQAQSMGKAYYYQDGEKKLAVTGDQLAQFKKSDRYDADSKKSALTQWANIAGKEGVSGLIAKPQKTIEGIKAQKPGNLSGNDKFITNWAKNYYTGDKQDDPDYLSKVESRLKTKVTKEASDAIASAVSIFGTDKRPDGTRMTEELMRKTLEDIGKVESGYRTRIAGGGRPERGYWQVLPSTAKDALKNAKGYFGPKFNDKFKEYGGYKGLSKLSKKELSKLLEKDDALGAAFAAVQVLRTFDK